MNKDIVQQMKNQLDTLVQTVQEEHIEFWFAKLVSGLTPTLTPISKDEDK